MRIPRKISLDETDAVGCSAISAMTAVAAAYYNTEINRAINRVIDWIDLYNLPIVIVMPWIAASLISVVCAAYFVGRHWRDAGVISRVIVSASLLISIGLIAYSDRVPSFSHYYHGFAAASSPLDESEPKVTEHGRRWFDPKPSFRERAGFSAPFCDNVLNADTLMATYYIELRSRARKQRWNARFERKPVEWAI